MTFFLGLCVGLLLGMIALIIVSLKQVDKHLKYQELARTQWHKIAEGKDTALVDVVKRLTEPAQKNNDIEIEARKLALLEEKALERYKQEDLGKKKKAIDVLETKLGTLRMI